MSACNFCRHYSCVYGDGLIGRCAALRTKLQKLRIIRIWSKKSVKQFVKSKSTFKNNIYCSVFPGLVKSIWSPRFGLNFWANFMHGSILPVTITPRATPGTCPALRSRGWGIVWSCPVPGGGGRGKSKITSCNSCEVRHFLVDLGPRGEDCIAISRENF